MRKGKTCIASHTREQNHSRIPRLTEDGVHRRNVSIGSRGHGAIQERAAERPGSCATKQPLPPAKPSGTHLPPKSWRRSSCQSCCQTSQKDAGLSRPAASDLHAQDHQPGTAMLASQLGKVLSFLRLARAKDFPSVVAEPR